MLRVETARGHRVNSESGSSAIEVVIVLPVMMIAILLAIQVALWVNASELVQASAAIGSETAAGFGGSSVAGESAARSYLAAHAPGLEKTTDVEITATSSGLIETQVSARVPQILPFVLMETSALRVEPEQEFRTSG
jgi:Flp pilus assembly protein TadG